MASKELIEELMRELLPDPPQPAISAAEHNRRVRQQLAEERWEERQRGLEAERRQRAIDAVWERTLAERAEAEAAAARYCHRGPGDPDWPR